MSFVEAMAFGPMAPNNQKLVPRISPSAKAAIILMSWKGELRHPMSHSLIRYGVRLTHAQAAMLCGWHWVQWLSF